MTTASVIYICFFHAIEKIWYYIRKVWAKINLHLKKHDLLIEFFFLKDILIESI